jgi:lysophospholipase L1-like esterase
MTVRFARYVALGDSTTEGMDDPDGAGGYRGWADRLAEHVAAAQGELAYANLGVRGRCAHEIRAEQLPAALAFAPDLATVVAGMNDLLRPRFDAVAIGADIGAMQRALIGRGCTVLTFTIPDIAHRLAFGPFATMLSRRTRALDDEIRVVSAAAGAILVDLAAHPLASDPRMWAPDRLHANTLGHARTAAALAHALALPGSDARWLDPLPALPPPPWHARVADDLAWTRDHLLPWLWRRVRPPRGAAPIHGPKRPDLRPVVRRERFGLSPPAP